MRRLYLIKLNLTLKRLLVKNSEGDSSVSLDITSLCNIMLFLTAVKMTILMKVVIFSNFKT